MSKYSLGWIRYQQIVKFKITENKFFLSTGDSTESSKPPLDPLLDILCCSFLSFVRSVFKEAPILFYISVLCHLNVIRCLRRSWFLGLWPCLGKRTIYAVAKNKNKNKTIGPLATIRSSDKKQHICKCHAISSRIATATRTHIWHTVKRLTVILVSSVEQTVDFVFPMLYTKIQPQS